MTRRLTVLLAAVALSATMAGTAQARPVNADTGRDLLCPAGTYLQVAHCQPYAQHGPGRWAI